MMPHEPDIQISLNKVHHEIKFIKNSQENVDIPVCQNF